MMMMMSTPFNNQTNPPQPTASSGTSSRTPQLFGSVAPAPVIVNNLPMPAPVFMAKGTIPSSMPLNQVLAQALPAGEAVVSRRIGTILLEKGLVSPEKLSRALAEAKASGEPIGKVLVSSGFVTEEQLGKGLAELHQLEYISVKGLVLKPEIMKLLPEDFIRQNCIIPYHLDLEEGRLEVIMARPDKTKVLDDIALMTRYRVMVKLSTSSELSEMLDAYYAKRYSADQVLEALEVDVLKNETLDAAGSNVALELETEAAANSAPVVQFVNALLTEAADRNASDIHIEPQPQRLLVRFRKDGILHEAQSLSLKMAASIISRIKVIAGMDISERRRPQDGRIKHQVGSSSVDMRVNSIPLQYGEKLVIRLLKMNAGTSGIEHLGLDPEDKKKLAKMIRSPHGIILVTGPTGSGKTSTLYASLRDINTPDRNISTIEDPIEYVLPGVNQMQVQPKAGLTFASCLRALLRQDPDILMVGEIRDSETLDAALNASLTGHLVFSTIHTNSTAKTISRLLEMGAPSYLVSTSVIGIIAQRLVRKLCDHCKEPYTATTEEYDILGLSSSESAVQLYQSVGCKHCGNTGFSGRTGLYELMPVSRHLAQLIDSGISSVALEDAAVAEGMKTLAMQGKVKALNGETTLAEVVRVLGFELGNTGDNKPSKGS
jgi:type IV pilus assembly protein PilB